MYHIPNFKEMSKEEMNKETRKVLDQLPYEDAELLHKMIINLAIRKGILK